MSQPITLTQVAVDLLNVAATKQPKEREHFSEARGIWQPNTWLLQRCWQILADAGAPAEAIRVAALVADRHPVAPYQALHTLSLRVTPDSPHFSPLQDELTRLSSPLFHLQLDDEPAQLGDRLLYTAATAAQMGEQTLAFACLERLDQIPRAWDRVFVHPDMRQLLAQTVAQVGLHPLTGYLIDTAIRHFSDSGAHFLHQVALALRTESERGLARHQQRVLTRCVNALRNAVLLTLHSRRIAAIVMAQAGEIEEMLSQLDTIAKIQEAHRETGQPQRIVTSGPSSGPGSATGADGDGVLLRQVTRPRADADIDFQVHTLQSAVDVLQLERLAEQDRRTLVQRLADLGMRSDGWTAAGAISTLIKLGDVNASLRVMNHIAPHDATRSEGVLSLVASLMESGHQQLAMQQVEKALQWARSLDERMPERVVTWGLADIFLRHNIPEMALNLLGEPPTPTWGERLGQLVRGQWPGSVMTDTMLRTDRIRLQALLLREQNRQAHPNGAAAPASELPPEIDALARRIGYWAPRLLDGETLINFYLDGLLRPLLAAGQARYAWGLLPQLQEALQTVRGAKYAAHLATVMQQLTVFIDPAAEQFDEAHAGAMRHHLSDFAVALWTADAEQGIWRAVYGVEGALPLLLCLEGPAAIMQVAQAAADASARWTG